MTPRARRALFSIVLFLAVCAVAGSILQRRVGAQSSADESQLRDSLKSFTNVYALVEQNYAEPIDGDKADSGHLRRGDSRHAASAGPALQFLRSQGLRQDARGAARPLLRRGHAHPAAGQQGLRSHALRGHALIPRRHSPRRHHLRGGRQERRGHDAQTWWPRRSKAPKARTCR